MRGIKTKEYRTLNPSFACCDIGGSMVREADHTMRRPHTATSKARSGARLTIDDMVSARSVLHVTKSLCDTTY